MDDRIPLTVERLTELNRAAQEREDTIIRDVLQVPDYPPLPACPECDDTPAQIKSMVEPPSFGQDGTPVLLNFGPCGHRFRIADAAYMGVTR